MENIVKGKAWTFGDNINTESIMPTGTDHTPSLARDKVLKFYDPDFAPNVQPGDIVVTGTNLGNSSARPACRVFGVIGVPVVICESAARIFYMHSWNYGIACLECPGITKMVSKGDILEVDIMEGKVKNLTTGAELQAEKTADVYLERWKAGGLVGWINSRRSEYDTLE